MVFCEATTSSTEEVTTTTTPPTTPPHPPRCVENEILLRNRTCLCPFFRFNGRCLRRRYQTTVNTTVAQLRSATRHLLMDDTPLLLTIDASNQEAMQALAASLAPLMPSVPGTVVTSVVDAMDVQVGGEPSASMEIVNASVSGTVLTLTATTFSGSCTLVPRPRRARRSTSWTDAAAGKWGRNSLRQVWTARRATRWCTWSSLSRGGAGGLY